MGFITGGLQKINIIYTHISCLATKSNLTFSLLALICLWAAFTDNLQKSFTLSSCVGYNFERWGTSVCYAYQCDALM